MHFYIYIYIYILYIYIYIYIEGTGTWNKWWNIEDFGKSICKCEELTIKDDSRRVESWEVICKRLLCNKAVSKWYELEINRVESKAKNTGGNKLRTYALFKQEWGYERYLDIVQGREKRILLTKFRIGICPLRIETGRYELVDSGYKQVRRHIDAKLRYCLCCNTQRVEDEFHFLMVCPIYVL